MEKNKKIKVPECGFVLNQIYFYLTEGCNLRCRHCWIEPKYQTEKAVWPSLDFEVFKDTVKQGQELGMRGVKLTGGEPLIHPDIDKIIDYIYQENLQLTIETNGLKCSPELVKKISQRKNSFVSISLDGSRAEEHEWVRGVEGSFEMALDGLRNLVKYGVKNQIIMSVMKKNAHQIEDIVRLAEKENIDSVKFNLVTPTARGEQMHDAGETLPIEELVKIGEWVENTLQASTKVRLHYSHPAAFIPFSKMFKNPQGRCGIFGIIGVLGSGKYALCGIGETVPELIFGDAKTDRLKDVWNNSEVLNDIRKGLPGKLTGVCGDCLLRKKCLASCIAMNYYRHKNLFAPFWYCEEALNKGVFPKSRIRPGSESDNIL